MRGQAQGLGLAIYLLLFVARLADFALEALHVKPATQWASWGPGVLRSGLVGCGLGRMPGEHVAECSRLRPCLRLGPWLRLWLGLGLELRLGLRLAL